MSNIPIQQKKHSVSIKYCVPCDYSQQALVVVRTLVRDYQHVIERVELIMGSKGTFDVAVDGDVLFSKADQKHFPEEGEILELFERAVGTQLEKYPRN